MSKKPGALLLLAGLWISSLGAVRAEDTVDSLKQQVAALQREVNLVRRERDLLQKEVDQLRAGKAESGAKRPEGEITGVIWEIDVIRPNGSVFATKRFLAAEGKIYMDAREIGTYTENGSRARMDITRATDDRANGVYELLRTSNNPPTYAGRLRNKRGENPQIQLRVIKD